MISKDEAIKELKRRGFSNNQIKDLIKQPQEQPNELIRQIARTGKSLASGAASVGDLVNIPFNAAAGALGYPNYFGNPSETVKQLFDKFTNNIARPQNRLEEIQDTASEFIAGGGSLGAISKSLASSAPKVAQGIGKLSPQNTKELISLGTAGAGSQGFADEQGNQSIVGGLIGGAVPYAGNLSQLPKSLAQVNKDKLEITKAAGLNPTLADVSDSKIVKKFQNILSNLPFTSSTIKGSIEENQKQLDKFLNTVKRNKNLTENEAGQLAKDAISKYENAARDKTKVLKENVDKFITGDGIDLSNFNNVVDNLPKFTSKTAQQLARNTESGKYIDLIKQVAEENNGKISFNDLTLLRQNIDDKINNFGLMGLDKEQGQLKNLRGAIKEDIRDFFKKSDPNALKAYDEYNNFYSKFAQEKEKVLDKLTKDKSTTEIFRKIVNNQNVDAKFAKAVLNKMNPYEKEVFSGSLINNLGLNRENDFVPSVLARKFKSLEPEAQEVILSSFDNDTKNKFRNVIEAIDLTRETGKEANFSNTANNLLTTSFVTNFTSPSQALGLLFSTLGAGKLFTNPKAINWLADNINTPINMAPQAIQQLQQLAKEDEQLQPLANYLSNSMPLESDNIMSTPSRDEILQELKRRGIDTSQF